MEYENTKLSGKILLKDGQVDELYLAAINILSAYVQKKAEFALCALKTMLMIRKIERIGDHCSNIVEEIVFYIDAKVLKHTNNKVSD